MEVNLAGFVDVDEEVFAGEFIELEEELELDFLVFGHKFDFLEDFVVQNVVDYDNGITDSNALLKLIEEVFAPEGQ